MTDWSELDSLGREGSACLHARHPREQNCDVAVVGMGHVSQVAVLAAFQHAKDESNKYEKNAHQERPG